VVAMLDGLGYRVLTARNGPEAIDILKTDQPIDLLFSDVIMPRGMSGVDVAKEAQRLRAGIKILLTSGYTAEVLRQQGASGNFPVFSKPYRQHELAAEIERVLHGPPPRHAASGPSPR
jgi:CheY-like chemotaxis protein